MAVRSLRQRWSSSCDMRPRVFFAIALALGAMALSGGSSADQALVTFGAGPQPGSDQRHATAGVDYSFYSLRRSERQHLLVGISYTRLQANLDSNDDMYAVSVYPQLSLFPSTASRISSWFPNKVRPFFFVRALGPSYISESRIGGRRQSRHFSFQAQVGAGVLLGRPGQKRGILAVSWKHFSNANLYSENDGIDVPLVVNLGFSF